MRAETWAKGRKGSGEGGWYFEVHGVVMGRFKVRTYTRLTEGGGTISGNSRIKVAKSIRR